MSRIRDRDTIIERLFCDELFLCGITTFSQNDSEVLGKPDFVILNHGMGVETVLSAEIDDYACKAYEIYLVKIPKMI